MQKRLPLSRNGGDEWMRKQGNGRRNFGGVPMHRHTESQRKNGPEPNRWQETF